MGRAIRTKSQSGSGARQRRGVTCKSSFRARAPGSDDDREVAGTTWVDTLRIVDRRVVSTQKLGVLPVSAGPLSKQPPPRQRSKSIRRKKF